MRLVFAGAVPPCQRVSDPRPHWSSPASPVLFRLELAPAFRLPLDLRDAMGVGYWVGRDRLLRWPAWTSLVMFLFCLRNGACGMAQPLKVLLFTVQCMNWNKYTDLSQSKSWHKPITVKCMRLSRRAGLDMQTPQRTCYMIFGDQSVDLWRYDLDCREDTRNDIHSDDSC